MLRQTCLGVAVVLGLGALANGAFMLVSPANWYFAVPGVTTTGPFNQHFLRDIGLIYMMMGGGFLAGIARARDRVVIWAASTLWLAGHALFHFWEVSVGICGPSALLRDFPGVTIPAILGLALTVAAMRRNARTPLPRRT